MQLSEDLQVSQVAAVHLEGTQTEQRSEDKLCISSGTTGFLMAVMTHSTSRINTGNRVAIFNFLGFFKNLPDVTGTKPLYGNRYFGLIPEKRDHNE